MNSYQNYKMDRGLLVAVLLLMTILGGELLPSNSSRNHASMNTALAVDSRAALLDLPESAYPSHCQQSLQNWQPYPSKSDLMVFTTHADDEGIFFGGALPYYTQVRGKTAILIGMNADESNHANINRREELERAAWHYGVRYKPINFQYPDVNRPDTAEIWDPQRGINGIIDRIATEIRRYKPDVIITHDFDGEYGHNAHKVTAEAVEKAIPVANSPQVNLEGLPTWEVKKLYIHLYQSPRGSEQVPAQLVTDAGYMYHTWEERYPELGNKSSRQVALEGLECHVDAVRAFGSVPVSSRFVTGELFDGLHAEDWGLFRSTVGRDTCPNDFFQNIDGASCEGGDQNNPPTINLTWSGYDLRGTVGQTSGGVTFRSSDPDGDSLTFSASGLPPGMSINRSNGTITGSFTEAGTYNITVTADDGRGGRDSVGFRWIVDGDSPPPATEPPQVYDGFASNSGSTLANASTGYGWAGNWQLTQNGGLPQMVSGSLSYGNLPATGNSLQTHQTTENGNGLVANRSLETPITSGDVWMSYRVRATNVGSGHLFVGSGNTLDSGIGKRWGTNFAINNSDTPLAMQAGQTYFLVAKYVLNPNGADQVYMWVNPNLTREPSTSSADVATSKEIGPVDRVYINIQDYGLGRYQLDEVRLGTTWEQMLTSNTTPPPPPPQTQLGDVNCDDTVDTVDALFIMQYTVGMRTDSSGCPLSDSAGQIHLAVGDVSGDNEVSVVDALFVMQCVVGIENAFCPGD